MIAVNMMAYSKPKVEKKMPTRENYTFSSKIDWTLPEGAMVKSKEKYVSVREIENGYIIEETISYCYYEKKEENGKMGKMEEMDEMDEMDEMGEMGEMGEEETGYAEYEKYGSEVKTTYSKTKPKVVIS